MRITARAALIPLSISVLCGGLLLACPGWSAEIGADDWLAFDAADALCKQRHEAAELRDVNSRVQKRLSLKQMIAQDLVDGRLTLREAAAQFQSLNELNPECMTVMRDVYRGATDEENCARQVIAFARTRLGDDPSREQEVHCRLEAELQVVMAGSER